MKNIFENESYETLNALYNDIIREREEGLRPPSLDKFIEQIQKDYPLTVGEAWRYTENMFWEEVARRYFQSHK